jgi:very-short-patch-repair endonuclease
MPYIKNSDPEIDLLPDEQHAALIKVYEYGYSCVDIRLHILEKLVESNMIMLSSENKYELSQIGREYLSKIKSLREILQKRDEYIDRNILSIKLRLFRKINKLSVVKMAHLVELSPLDILNVEGTGKCNLNHIEKICERFKMNINNFLTKSIPTTIDLENIHFTDSEIEDKLLNDLLIQLKFERNYKIESQKDFKVNNKNYRVDFLITYKDDQNNTFKLIVECDGHNYHERTKEQAKKDKSRDREFLSLGIPTIRFTGSEINDDSSECASEVFTVLWSYANNLKVMR